MGHARKADIYQAVSRQLKSLHRFGESKFEAKQAARAVGSGPVRALRAAEMWDDPAQSGNP